MEISTNELANVWPKLDERTKQAIYIAVLEQRLSDREMALGALEHQIEVLEQAVKAP